MPVTRPRCSGCESTCTTPPPSAAPRQWLLELAYPPLDHLDLYLPTQGVFRLAQRTGDALPYASRQIRQNNYLFELPLQPGRRPPPTCACTARVRSRRR
jgi:hypothetical protein